MQQMSVSGRVSAEPVEAILHGAATLFVVRGGGCLLATNPRYLRAAVNHCSRWILYFQNGYSLESLETEE